MQEGGHSHTFLVLASTQHLHCPFIKWHKETDDLDLRNNVSRKQKKVCRHLCVFIPTGHIKALLTYCQVKSEGVRLTDLWMCPLQWPQCKVWQAYNQWAQPFKTFLNGFVWWQQLLVTQVINNVFFLLVAVITVNGDPNNSLFVPWKQNESSTAHCKRSIVFCFHVQKMGKKTTSGASK